MTEKVNELYHEYRSGNVNRREFMKKLAPHIQDVNRRMAMEGFIALAPDALSPLGGTPENDDDKGREMIGQLDRDATVKNFVAAVKYLKTHPRSSGKVGC